MLNELFREIAPGSKGQSYRALAPKGPHLLAMGIHGSRKGPLIVFTAGVHGDEYEGPFALLKWFDQLDPAQLTGRVVLIPFTNPFAWRAGTRETPEDGDDLNRKILKKRQADGLTDHLGESVYNQLVQPADILVDYHSGGNSLLHQPMAGWYGAGGEVESFARGMGKAFHPWQIPDVPGVLSYEAHRAGKLSIGCEFGGGGSLDPHGVEAYSRSSQNLLRHLELVPGDPFDPAEGPPIRGNYQVADQSGIFIPKVELGSTLCEGEPIGSFHSLDGGQDVPVLAQASGKVAGLAIKPHLRRGQRVAYIG